MPIECKECGKLVEGRRVKMEEHVLRMHKNVEGGLVGYHRTRDFGMKSWDPRDRPDRRGGEEGAGAAPTASSGPSSAPSGTTSSTTAPPFSNPYSLTSEELKSVMLLMEQPDSAATADIPVQVLIKALRWANAELFGLTQLCTTLANRVASFEAVERMRAEGVEEAEDIVVGEDSGFVRNFFNDLDASQNKEEAKGKKRKKIIRRCDLCSFSSEQVRAIRCHYRNVHIGSRRFLCDQCSASFKRSGALREHNTLVHHGLKDISCSVCEARFSRRSSLNQHNRSVHGEGLRVNCDECGRWFSRRSSLKDHAARVHLLSAKKIPCPTCSFPFGKSRDLRRHLAANVCRMILERRKKVERRERRREKVKRVESKRNYLCHHCAQYITFKNDAEPDKHLLAGGCVTLRDKTTKADREEAERERIEKMKSRCKYCEAELKDRRQMRKHLTPDGCVVMPTKGRELRLVEADRVRKMMERLEKKRKMKEERDLCPFCGIPLGAVDKRKRRKKKSRKEDAEEEEDEETTADKADGHIVGNTCRTIIQLTGGSASNST